ncbi:MAG: hypothetical protein GWM92_05465 [Gemmatimonadetes bacterium]|nr:hypothetical protein [Gemmatimonadota bacterium]NIR80266.1 hypothetical protein [Gemmatimonadota bacterium]NIT86592.1 hypothetical protein [Gemmatimonadota bacterium]NIU32822.1 hypothetical protein [Gemmatimonadota bacterium]NIU37242.1 hypothetical protein [Gemmatimonadota bacterium]
MGPPADELGPGERGTSNVEVVAHLPLGGYLHVADVEIEQELDRPFAYVSKRFHPTGFDVISLADEESARVIHRWRMENSELHTGSGALDGRYFKHGGRYYYVQSFQFGQGGPNPDLGAIVFDVTGLPDPDAVREVGRIAEPDVPGGFHNIFMYKHSDGRPLLFTTTRGPPTSTTWAASWRGAWKGPWWPASRCPRRPTGRWAAVGDPGTTSTWATTPPRTRTASGEGARGATSSTTSPTPRARSCSRRSPGSRA